MGGRFGDMLIERRRQMGASIQQVSNIVKIRPQIIEYFETENFAAMPPRGYAQGMIASYARYLGLNPREVVDAYFDALHEYEHGNGGRVGRFQDAAADASPRSSNASGRYMMVNPGPSSRFAQRPPQAGYVSESTSPHEPVSSARLRPDARVRRGSGGGYDPTLRSRTSGRAAGHAQTYRAAQQPSARFAHPSMPRRGRAGTDDPRAFDAHPECERRARPLDAPRPNRRGGGARGRHERGSAARFSLASLDMRLLIAGIIVVLVGFALFMALMLRGCAPAPRGAGSAGASKVSRVDKARKTDEPPKDEPSFDEEAGSAEDGGESQDGEGNQAAVPQPAETIVKVSLKEKGAVAWIEVKLDGKVILGKQVVGPFEEEFTVMSQVDITTDSPGAVSIFKNDEKVRYDTKVSGVGKVSISAPAPPTAPDAPADDQGASEGSPGA